VVYADKLRTPFRGFLMPHMMADTEAELDAMAKSLGLDPTWKQPGNCMFPPHFDLAESKRKEAIRQGAKEVTTQELVKKMMDRKR
jgi:Protein of unknown function (DUF4031)